jgi:hypothetical protein
VTVPPFIYVRYGSRLCKNVGVHSRSDRILRGSAAGLALSKQTGLMRRRVVRSFLRMKNPFRYFNSSPEIIRLTVMMYIRYPLSLRQVEDLLFDRGVDICHETVRFWWNRFGPMFAAEIRRRRVHHDHIRTGVGTWTRCSCESTERRITCGVLSTTKARYWKFLPRNGGIARPRFSF